MNTTCYCIYCRHYPLHKEYMENKELFLKKYNLSPYSKNTLQDINSIESVGKRVNCFEPEALIEDECNISMKDYRIPVCSYHDGFAGFELILPGADIYGWCNNEDHEEKS